MHGTYRVCTSHTENSTSLLYNLPLEMNICIRTKLSVVIKSKEVERDKQV